MLECGLFLVLALVAAVLLGIRDYWRGPPKDDRSLAQKIADIRTGAASMADQLTSRYDQHLRSDPARPPEWVPAIVEFFRRLEAFAADPAPDVSEILKLADEASTYVRNRQLKGLDVGAQAERLARLVESEDSPPP